jgi:hypothetical protein
VVFLNGRQLEDALKLLWNIEKVKDYSRNISTLCYKMIYRSIYVHKTTSYLSKYPYLPIVLSAKHYIQRDF